MGMIGILPSHGYQDVGSDYGTSWLENNGTMPVSTQEANSLWNWGNAPKGYSLHNGVLYPPGTEPEWYYPTSMTSSTPIIINESESNQLQSTYDSYTDPWLLAQLSGRPVYVTKDSTSKLI